MHSPYFPVPFSPGMLQGSADAGFPQLVPQITLADGSVLMPLAWFRDVKVLRKGAVTEVSWRQDALDRIGGRDAVEDPRATIVTRYRFAPGRIERSDRIVASAPIAAIAIEFASFSSDPVSDASSMRFGTGEVTRFAAAGYGRCAATPADAPQYRAPTGAFATVVRCRRAVARGESTIALGWSLSYN